MNAASEALCKELYDLTGWEDTGERYMGWINGPLDLPQYRPHFGGMPSIPAYGLDYLREKLLGRAEPADLMRALLAGADATAQLAIDSVQSGVIPRGEVSQVGV